MRENERQSGAARFIEVKAGGVPPLVKRCLSRLPRVSLIRSMVSLIINGRLSI